MNMKDRRGVAVALSAFVLAAGALASGLTAGAAGPLAPGLGSAASFAVLAGSGITNTGTTTINGDVGSHPTTTQTGFGSVVLTGTNHGGDAVTQGAKADLTAAYLEAAGRAPATTIPTELGGTIRTGGVYTSAAGTFGITGNVTLDGQGDPTSVFIFQMASTLTTAASSSVTLIGGAQSCNVFWQVGSSATLGGSTTFRGTILALTSITLVTNATIDGRALARNGAVTLDSNVITRPTCAPIPVEAPAPTPAPPTATPTATPTRTPTPVATPIAAPTAGPTAAPAPATTPAVGGVGRPPGSLPSTSTQDLEGVPSWLLVLLLAAFVPFAVVVHRRGG